jgi:hypothetical protein
METGDEQSQKIQVFFITVEDPSKSIEMMGVTVTNDGRPTTN